MRPSDASRRREASLLLALAGFKCGHLVALRFVTAIFASAAPAPGRFSPLAIQAQLPSRPTVSSLLGTGVVETFLFFGAYGFLGAFLKLRCDLSFTVIGLILACYGLGGLLYSAPVKRLTRALGERGLLPAEEARSAACFSWPSPSHRIGRIPFLAPSVSASPPL